MSPTLLALEFARDILDMANIAQVQRFIYVKPHWVSANLKRVRRQVRLQNAPGRRKARREYMLQHGAIKGEWRK